MSAVIDASIANRSPVPLTHGDGVRPIAFDAAGAISLDSFSRQVRAVAAMLPAGQHAINLCEDRYRFLVAFCAAAVRGQTTLMPPSRAPAVIDQVREQYPDSYCLGDDALALVPPDCFQLPQPLPELDGSPLQLQADAVVAIGFTSGSTGQPRPYAKTWASFRTSTAQNLAALAGLLDDCRVTHAVATVPPQHMYGMEMSVLLPLLGPVAVHSARPLFPADVARALHDAPTPPLLVTTPVHLRALVAEGLELPQLAGIVSATAPLPAELALAAEERFGCEVREVFGSTETCVIARRRTARETAWTPLPGIRLAPQPDGTAVHAPHLPEPVVLADLVEVDPHDGRFELRGRNADMLEIAGKRASLGDLTRKLLAVPGVVDGVVFQLEDADAMGVRRIAALAVAPGIDEAAIVSALRKQIDPVFLPRPLRRVAALPRNETGKLPRGALAALLHG
ncbi:MAG TPA: AMP-binding protein [Lysobacter sp.]